MNNNEVRRVVWIKLIWGEGRIKCFLDLFNKNVWNFINY